MTLAGPRSSPPLPIEVETPPLPVASPSDPRTEASEAAARRQQPKGILNLQNVLGIAKAYLVSIAAWSALSLISGWQYSVVDRSLKVHTSLIDKLILGEIRGFVFALLTPPVFYIVRRHAIGTKHFFRSLLIYLLGSIPFILCFVLVRWLVFPPWDLQRQRFIPRTFQSLVDLNTGSAEELFTYFGILVAAHAYGYFLKMQKRERQRREFQQALAASELQLLRMQLHPHFLFNTLNGIGTLIETDPETAKGVVLQLSHLLRTASDYGSTDLIPLQEELKFAEEYLSLEKMRLGDRLRVDWCIDPDTITALVPQMILQPLAENAIRHGISCSRMGGWIELASRSTQNGLELSVRNSLGGKSPGGTGLGLRNTEARLKHLFGDNATLSFALSPARTATATLLLPALRAEASAGSLPGAL